MEEGVRTSKRQPVKRRAFSPEAEPQPKRSLISSSTKKQIRKPSIKREKREKNETRILKLKSTPSPEPEPIADNSEATKLNLAFGFSPASGVTSTHDATPAPESASVPDSTPETILPSTSIAVLTPETTEVHESTVECETRSLSRKLSPTEPKTKKTENKSEKLNIQPANDISFLKSLHPLLEMSTKLLEDMSSKEFFARAVLLPIHEKKLKIKKQNNEDNNMDCTLIMNDQPGPSGIKTETLTHQSELNFPNVNKNAKRKSSKDISNNCINVNQSTVYENKQSKIPDGLITATKNKIEPTTTEGMTDGKKINGKYKMKNKPQEDKITTESGQILVNGLEEEAMDIDSSDNEEAIPSTSKEKQDGLKNNEDNVKNTKVISGILKNFENFAEEIIKKLQNDRIDMNVDIKEFKKMKPSYKKRRNIGNTLWNIYEFNALIIVLTAIQTLRSYLYQWNIKNILVTIYHGAKDAISKLKNLEEKYFIRIHNWLLNKSDKQTLTSYLVLLAQLKIEKRSWQCLKDYHLKYLTEVQNIINNVFSNHIDDPYMRLMKKFQRKLLFEDVQILVVQYSYRKSKSSKIIIDDYDKYKYLIINGFKKMGANVESITIANDWDYGDTFQKVSGAVVELSHFITKMQIANYNQKLFLISFDMAGSFVHLLSKLFPSLYGMINFGFRSIQKNFIRGIPGDEICNTLCPSLFVLGANSSYSKVEHLNLFKKNFVMPVGSVVVGYADHKLKIPNDVLIKMGISQCCVDRMIMEHVVDFIDVCCSTRDLMEPRNKKYKFEKIYELEEKMEAEGLKRKVEDTADKEKEKLRRKSAPKLNSEENSYFDRITTYIFESDQIINEHKINKDESVVVKLDLTGKSSCSNVNREKISENGLNVKVEDEEYEPFDELIDIDKKEVDEETTLDGLFPDDFELTESIC